MADYYDGYDWPMLRSPNAGRRREEQARKDAVDNASPADRPAVLAKYRRESTKRYAEWLRVINAAVEAGKRREPLLTGKYRLKGER